MILRMDGETNEKKSYKKRIKIFCVLVLLTAMLVVASAWRVRLPSEMRLFSYDDKRITVVQKLDRHTVLVKHNRTSPNRLCFRFMGRLGNNMFQFAALIGIASTKGMTPVIHKTNRLLTSFELAGITTLDYHLCRHLKVHRDRHSCAYDRYSVDFPTNKDMGLFGYFQSWRYFNDSVDKVRNLFTFKTHVSALVKENLKKSVVDQHGDLYKERTVLIGVHIRRGDIASSARNKHGYVVASLEYLHKAMNYFRERFHRVLFVVCSDDKMWPFLHLPHNDSIFITGQSAELDMATLVQCNHTIMTVGSFGWWSAWLTDGITLYPSQQYRPGSPLAKQFKLTDYFPANWKAIY